VTNPILVQAHKDIQGILDRLGIATQLPFELLQTVVPVIAFERPTPSTERLCWGRVGESAVAAQNSHVGIFNPTGSGRLIHVDSILLRAAAATELIPGERDTAYSSPSSDKGFRDRRVPGTPAAVLATQTNAGALLAVRGEAAVAAVNEMAFLPIDAYIEEGQGVGLYATTVNMALAAGFYWEELLLAEL